MSVRPPARQVGLPSSRYSSSSSLSSSRAMHRASSSVSSLSPLAGLPGAEFLCTRRPGGSRSLPSSGSWPQWQVVSRVAEAADDEEAVQWHALTHSLTRILDQGLREGEGQAALQVNQG